MNRKEAIKYFLEAIGFYNPNKNINETAREMLSENGSTYIKPGTITIEARTRIDDPEGKRAILNITAENLISQNPSRKPTIS